MSSWISAAFQSTSIRVLFLRAIGLLRLGSVPANPKAYWSTMAHFCRHFRTVPCGRAEGTTRAASKIPCRSTFQVRMARSCPRQREPGRGWTSRGLAGWHDAGCMAADQAAGGGRGLCEAAGHASAALPPLATPCRATQKRSGDSNWSGRRDSTVRAGGRWARRGLQGRRPGGGRRTGAV
jgi:hypothetical protein